MSFLSRWLQSPGDRLRLDVLLDQAPLPSAPLRERLDWIGKLVHWVRKLGPESPLVHESKLEAGDIEGARLKYVLHVLDHNEDLKLKTARALRSIIGDTRALEFFMAVGMPSQNGFIGELLERVSVRFLPQAPDDRDLGSIFSETFRYESDAVWIRRLDPSVFGGWIELFHFGAELEDESAKPWNTLLHDAGDALFILSRAVGSAGLSGFVRYRTQERDFRRLPFYVLPDRAQALIEARGPAAQAEAYTELRYCLDACSKTLAEVNSHFADRGVTIALVYQLGRLQARVRRCTTLARLLAGEAGYGDDPFFAQGIFGRFVEENIRARKLSRLLNDNLVLVSRKIVETNAETGEHYITRDRREHWVILRKAAGGGVVTGFTTAIKFGLAHLTAPLFVSGLLAFGNYAASFLFLQFAGFTLATKQPAMTATSLAAKIGEADESIEPLTDEIVHLVRSQLAAVLGNISLVVPTVMGLSWLLSRLGTHLTDAEHARKTLESFSILGMTPFYAAWTGVLLWLSSVFAGWFGNWFNFRRLPAAVEHHPRLRFVLGVERARRLGQGLQHQVGGIAASVSLAFLLGMTPQFAAFLGLPLDVRHVTLSSGAMTASVMALGSEVVSTWLFWLAVGGVASMAVLNLAVSFALALIVAIWAKRASGPGRGVIYRAVLRKLLREPWVFLLPSVAPKASGEIDGSVGSSRK
jgi:site-specific recombinase